MLFRADLKDAPDGAYQDPFGNFTINVNTLAGFSALPECQPQLHHQQQEATTLTSEFGAATLAIGSEAATKPASKGTGQRRASQARGQSGSNNKEPLDAKNIRKHLALQEKNRRAQRRFRERQKQKVHARHRKSLCPARMRLGAQSAHKYSSLALNSPKVAALPGLAGGPSLGAPHTVCSYYSSRPPLSLLSGWQVEELSGQVEQLTAQLNAVLAEKCSLESRTGVLENVLAVREKQLEAAGRGEPVDLKAPVRHAFCWGGLVGHCQAWPGRSQVSSARRGTRPFCGLQSELSDTPLARKHSCS